MLESYSDTGLTGVPYIGSCKQLFGRMLEVNNASNEPGILEFKNLIGSDQAMPVTLVTFPFNMKIYQHWRL